MSLTAGSAKRKSRGRILAATFMATMLDILGIPRLMLFSVLLLHCRIVEPYSILVLTRVL